MTTAHLPSLSMPVAWRLRIDEVAVGLVGAVVWLHLIDASLVHRQANATTLEHLLLGLLALAAPPLAFVAYTRATRAWRAAFAAAAGLVAGGVGGVVHVAGVVRNDEWVRSDLTGVSMMVAGAVLLVLGVILITLAIPRWRYRLLLIPGVVVALMFVIAPLGMSVFITHVPRQMVTPRDLGADYEVVSFVTDDGLTLQGWYVPSQNGAAIAVLHGSGGSRMGPTEHVRMLVRHGYGVLVFDARGHGESEGGTNAVGWGAYPDLAAAAAYLTARVDVEPGRIGVLGLSMGAEIAIESAAHDDAFAAIVADGPSGRTFADARDSSPRPSAMAELGTVFILDLAVGALSGEWPPPGLASLSPLVTEPVLYIASGTVRFERNLVTKVAERSGGDAELWVIDGAGHTRGLETFPAEYEARVIEFLDRTLGGARP